MTDSRNSIPAIGSDLSIRDLLTVIFKRRWLIVATATVVLATAAVATLTAPRMYEVTASFLVNRARAEIPLTAKESQQLIISQTTEQDLNSEIEVLKSQYLIEEVLRTLEIGEPDEPQPWTAQLKSKVKEFLGEDQLSYFDQMVVAMQSDVKVHGVRNSNVIRIAYQSTDPEWATEFVGTMTDKYLERRANMYQSPQALVFFEEQMHEAEQQLADREQVLQDFLRSADVTMVKGPEGTDVMATQKALVLERMGQLKSEASNARVDMEEFGSRVAGLRQTLAEVPERKPSANRNNQDASVEQIEKGLAELELERDRLLQDFKPDSRYVRDIDTQIRLARERLQEIQSSEGSIDGTEQNPIYNQIKSDLMRAESELEGARGRYASLQTLIAAHSEDLDQLNSAAFEIETLRRDVEAAEEAYVLYRKKHEEARISAAMDQERLINVTVAQPAQRPLTPLPRRFPMKMLLALMAGIMGGLALAFGIEFYLDHSFTTGEEMERRLQIPHLASIPEEALR